MQVDKKVTIWVFINLLIAKENIFVYNLEKHDKVDKTLIENHNKIVQQFKNIIEISILHLI